jgi:hypothetical protein
MDQTVAEAYEDVPSWLAEDYPALFAAPRLLDRLRIYAIAFEVRQVLMHPPAGASSPHHPLHRLVRLLTRRSYLDDLRLP